MERVKINGLRLLLPASIDFEEDGVQKSLFVYIDQINNDVIIPENSDVKYLKNLEEVLKKYLVKSRVVVDVPNLPKKGFNKNSENYMDGL